MRDYRRSATDEQYRDFLSLSIDERIALALKLGQDEIAQVMAEEGVDRDEARRLIRRRNSAGRRPSVANPED
jgi:hypothetical protein